MDNYAKFAKRWTYGQSFWSGGNQNRMSGVGFLFNNKTINIENVEVVVDGRALLIDVEKNGSKFRIINVYGHTDMKERTALFQTLQPFLCNRRQILTVHRKRVQARGRVQQLRKTQVLVH